MLVKPEFVSFEENYKCLSKNLKEGEMIHVVRRPFEYSLKIIKIKDRIDTKDNTSMFYNKGIRIKQPNEYWLSLPQNEAEYYANLKRKEFREEIIAAKKNLEIGQKLEVIGYPTYIINVI